MKKYWLVWLKVSTLSIQESFSHSIAATLFLLGKWFRLLAFLFFINLISRQTPSLAGYTSHQLIIIFLTFNFFDLLGQIFFRGIYWFREQIITGEFDFRLIKPMNPLFLALTRQTDILDLPMLIFVFCALIHLSWPISLGLCLQFCLLTLTSSLILTAIHIAIAALGILTTEVDHTIMIFRDLAAMAKFPIQVYSPPLTFFLTYIIPITIAYQYPAYALLNLITYPRLAIGATFAIIILIISLWSWQFALSRYASASS